MKKENILNRIGETNFNSFGSKITIIEYIDSKNVKVKFDNGYITTVTYTQFKRGEIKSPYCKSVFGIGYIGEGKYIVTVDHMYTKQYNVWESMLERCYSFRYQKKQITYIGCSVAEEWHNFQIFCKWYDENYYEVNNNETMNLDKDILHKGNKIYSPKTCIFVPRNINMLFVKSNATRGEYPIGVYLNKKNNKYEGRCSVNNKQVYLGTYSTSEDAFFLGYKPYKEKLIKDIANKYKNQIPKKLYEAMYTYKVEITD